jgi:hypothetical protein
VGRKLQEAVMSDLAATKQFPIDFSKEEIKNEEEPDLIEIDSTTQAGSSKQLEYEGKIKLI